MSARIVTVNLTNRAYDIYIGAGLTARIADFIPFDLQERSVYLITDEHVEPYMLNIRDLIIAGGAKKAEFLSLPSGEKTKSFKYFEMAVSWLLENGLSRDSLVLAVGGGVIGDLAGFAASVVMRGVPFIQIPTTLLAQVDSSVGGKTGINTIQGKNLVGSFYQPKAVVIDTDTLKTLPRRELLAGYAEIVKYALINDKSFFEWLDDNGKSVCSLDKEDLWHAIEKSVKAKALIVQTDERESDQRALLNLGHTFGHALEAVTKYDGRLLHGEAVAIGMVMAFELSRRMGLCEEEDVDRVETHLARIGLPTRAYMIDPPLKASASEIMKAMEQDKKAAAGKLRFILANGIGEAFIEDDVNPALVKQVIEDSLDIDKGPQKGILSMRGKFGAKGVKGLWRSAFSSRA